MCEAEKSGWRVDVGHTVAVIQKLNRNPYADRAWVEVARIPLDDAVEMAATLMRHRKRPLAHDADHGAGGRMITEVSIPANPPTPRNVQRLRDYLTTCWYAGW